MEPTERSRRRRAVRRADRLTDAREQEIRLAHWGWASWSRWVFDHPRLALALMILLSALTLGPLGAQILLGSP